MNWMQRMQSKLKERNLDEVVFLLKKGKRVCMRQMQNTEKNTRELHLEMVRNKVTYVRVY